MRANHGDAEDRCGPQRSLVMEMIPVMSKNSDENFVEDTGWGFALGGLGRGWSGWALPPGPPGTGWSWFSWGFGKPRHCLRGGRRRREWIPAQRPQVAGQLQKAEPPEMRRPGVTALLASRSGRSRLSGWLAHQAPSQSRGCGAWGVPGELGCVCPSRQTRQAHVQPAGGSSSISPWCCLLAPLHPSGNFLSRLLLLPVISRAWLLAGTRWMPAGRMNQCCLVRDESGIF